MWRKRILLKMQGVGTNTERTVRNNREKDGEQVVRGIERQQRKK